MKDIYELVGELYIQGRLIQDQLSDANNEISRLRNLLNLKNAGLIQGNQKDESRDSVVQNT